MAVMWIKTFPFKQSLFQRHIVIGSKSMLPQSGTDKRTSILGPLTTKILAPPVTIVKLLHFFREPAGDLCAIVLSLEGFNFWGCNHVVWTTLKTVTSMNLIRKPGYELNDFGYYEPYYDPNYFPSSTLAACHLFEMYWHNNSLAGNTNGNMK
jgi:hypothetical protein